LENVFLLTVENNFSVLDFKFGEFGGESSEVSGSDTFIPRLETSVIFEESINITPSTEHCVNVIFIHLIEIMNWILGLKFEISAGFVLFIIILFFAVTHLVLFIF
jgi:hypothetical protein